MPPIVARFDVEISGANCRPCGLSAQVQIVEHAPRLDARPALAGVDFEHAIEVLRAVENDTRPDRLAGLRRAAAPRRDRHAELGAHPHGGHHVVRRRGKRDHERHDLVDAGVGRVERPAEAIEPHVVRADRLGEGLVQRTAGRSLAPRPVDHGQFGHAHATDSLATSRPTQSQQPLAQPLEAALERLAARGERDAQACPRRPARRPSRG